MSGPRILVIDDEPQVHRFLRPALLASDYDIDRADTAAEGLRLAAARRPDLILLDLGLPDGDGQDVLVSLRAITQVPIVIISARECEAEKIRALDAGADDYVDKPFAVDELMARIRAGLRRALVQETGGTTWRFADVEVDLHRRAVTAAGQPILLSPREYDLLALLARNAGRVITHRQLLVSVWGPAHAHDVQYLRVYVGHLRQKLGGAFAVLLGTEPGVGYRLTEG